MFVHSSKQWSVRCYWCSSPIDINDRILSAQQQTRKCQALPHCCIITEVFLLQQQARSVKCHPVIVFQVILMTEVFLPQQQAMECHILLSVVVLVIVNGRILSTSTAGFQLVTKC